MKVKKYALIATALMIIGATSVKPAMAYFTDTQRATGMVTIKEEPSFEPHEKVEDMVKEVSIKNTGDYDVFVRVKAIYGKNFEVVMDTSKNNAGWSLKEDGFYYYDKVVAVGKESPKLFLKVNILDDAKVSKDFNIIIVQEATRALYDDNGVTCDWNKVITRSDQAQGQHTVEIINGTNTQQQPSGASTSEGSNSNGGEQ